jgi:hypothetical protein
MQLLEDSVFYNLLVNNNESLSDNKQAEHVPLSATPCATPLTVANQPLNTSLNAPLEYPVPTFQYPLLDYRFGIPQEHQLRTPVSEGQSSYQQSIFSDSVSMENESSQDDNNEFLMKDTLLQLKSEINKPTQKKFHKFYSATMLPNAGVIKPAAPTYHKCPFCQRSFKNKSYLSRHMKKHDVVKDYKCPFFSPEHTKCHHLNGEFSRKDTFKAHLKSIHFIYPIGVSKSDRNESGGRCAGCFKEFGSNNDWISQHIEAEECPGFAKFKDQSD